MEARTVSLQKKIAYALPAFALAMVGIPLYVYIPKFYSDVVGVNIAFIGTILLIVRVFDAVTDPLIGFASDRTISRFGRRRPYIAIGSILLAVSIYFLFHPAQLSETGATIWFALGIFMVFLFWTVVAVPYESLGPEISQDYHERTGLFGLRDGLLIAGTLAAAASPALVKGIFGLSASPADERATFLWLALLYGPLPIVFSWACVLAIKERPTIKVKDTSGIWKDLRYVAHNRPFTILLASYTIAAFGSNLPATLILYYVQYVLKADNANTFLLLYFVTGVLFLPVWIALSRRFEKKSTWLAAMALNTGAFFGVFFLGPGDILWYGILVVLSGIGFGATVALPSSMQADVIDYDELLSGTRREGQYIGFWSISKKIAAALGVGLALSMLGLVGYVPNVEQTPQVQLTLRVLYALIPSLCNVIALAIAFAYPISAKVHQQIRHAIAERQAGRIMGDPLYNDYRN